MFVSGREQDGRDGYWMVTPLAIGGADRPALPVVLGWVADPASAPAPPEGSADLVGWLQPPEGTGAVDDDPGDDVLPQLRIADLVQHVDQDLYGGYAVAQRRRRRAARRRAGAAPGRRAVHRGPQPLLRRRVVVLRRLRGADLVALAGRAVRATQREPQRGRGTARYRDDVKPMSRLLTTYRVLAIVVGVLLAFCSLVALPLKYLLTEGSSLQQFGEDASIMWLFHGWIFMVYVVVAFLLARKAGWSVGFTMLALAAGLIPLLIFWVERRVVHKLKAENPDLEPVGIVRT